RVVAEGAEHLRGHHAHAALVHAAGGHALVRADDHHAHAARLQHPLDAARDLRGHLLLHLEAARVGVHHPRELADADDLAIGQVADVRLADDRRHVVLAVRLELDVAQHDHLVVAGDLLEGAGEVLVRIQGVAAEPVAVGTGDPRRGVQQALARGVLAGPAQQGADGILGLLTGDVGGAGGVAHGWKLAVGRARILPASVGTPQETMWKADRGWALHFFPLLFLLGAPGVLDGRARLVPLQARAEALRRFPAALQLRLHFLDAARLVTAPRIQAVAVGRRVVVPGAAFHVVGHLPVDLLEVAGVVVGHPCLGGAMAGHRAERTAGRGAHRQPRRPTQHPADRRPRGPARQRGAAATEDVVLLQAHGSLPLMGQGNSVRRYVHPG